MPKCGKPKMSDGGTFSRSRIKSRMAEDSAAPPTSNERMRRLREMGSETDRRLLDTDNATRAMTGGDRKMSKGGIVKKPKRK